MPPKKGVAVPVKPAKSAKPKARTDGYHGMNVDGLKGLLRARGLQVGGKKAELIERLEESDATSGEQNDATGTEVPATGTSTKTSKTARAPKKMVEKKTGESPATNDTTDPPDTSASTATKGTRPKKVPANGYRATGGSGKPTSGKKTPGSKSPPGKKTGAGVEKPVKATRKEKVRAKKYSEMLSDIIAVMAGHHGSTSALKKTVFGPAYEDLRKALTRAIEIEEAEMEDAPAAAETQQESDDGSEDGEDEGKQEDPASAAESEYEEDQ